MVTLAQLDQLQTAEGERLLAEVRAATPTPATAIAIATRLRRAWPPHLVTAAMELSELRQRAAARFSRADDLWLTRDGLEQATAEAIASWRARRYAGATTIVDLCCGIGGDLLALAAANPDAHLTAVDRDPLHLRMATLNATAAGVANRITFIEADVREAPIPEHAAVFIDPARRNARGRLAAGESEPPLEGCLDLGRDSRRVGIKFAPGIDHDRIPVGWELETIALGPDLKEAVLWSPRLARVARAATVVSGDAVHRLEPVPGEPPDMRAPQPGDTLLDPNPAVTRAGLVADLARALGAAMIDERIAFLVTAQPATTPLARSLRVLASLPWHEKELKRQLRALDAGPIDIRRRGLAGDVDAIARRLRGRGSRPLVLAMTRVNDQPWAIVCEAT